MNKLIHIENHPKIGVHYKIQLHYLDTFWVLACPDTSSARFLPFEKFRIGNTFLKLAELFALRITCKRPLEKSNVEAIVNFK